MRKEENMNYIEGLDVINVGLGAVLYDTSTHQFYTPNTDTTANITDLPEAQPESAIDENAEAQIQKLLLDKELDTEFEQSGNSSDA